MGGARACNQRAKIKKQIHKCKGCNQRSKIKYKNIMENKKSLILKLSNFLNKLPNIGPRQAKRLAYFLARLSPDSLEEVAKLF